MKIITKYTSFLYIKYFLIVFIALELFYVGIDILTNIKDLPTSTNLFVLHFALTFVVASSYLLPISLVFALIIMKFNMIKNNELVSFYALGVSKNRLIITPFLICFFLTIIFIGLNFTNFAYANDYRKNLRDFAKTSDSLFLKYLDDFVFIKSINLRDKTAKNVKIFSIKDGNLSKKTEANFAKFDGKFWNLQNSNIIKFDSNLTLGGKNFFKFYAKEEQNLKGFYPQVLEKISDSSNTYSIIDAFNSLKLFDKANTSNIKTALYTMIFFSVFCSIFNVDFILFFAYNWAFWFSYFTKFCIFYD